MCAVSGCSAAGAVLALRPSPTAAMKCSYGGKGGKESEPARSSEKETKEGSEQRRVWDGAAGSSEESLRSCCTATALHGTSLGHPQISVPAQTMSMV